MITIIIEKFKQWYRDYELRFPSYQWWGIYTLILTLAMHLDPNLRVVEVMMAMQFAGTMFVIMGFLERRKKK